MNNKAPAIPESDIDFQAEIRYKDEMVYIKANGQLIANIEFHVVTMGMELTPMELFYKIIKNTEEILHKKLVEYKTMQLAGTPVARVAELNEPVLIQLHDLFISIYKAVS